jgi:hypothetical protein
MTGRTSASKAAILGFVFSLVRRARSARTAESALRGVNQGTKYGCRFLE